MRSVSLIERYHSALPQIPAPGEGCHTSLLSVANLGAFAGITPEVMFEDIRKAIPPGLRCVKDNEIWDTVNKAWTENNNGTFTPKPKPEPVVQKEQAKAVFQEFIKQAPISDEADLWEDSPIRPLDEPQGDSVLFFKTLFSENDLIWNGERHDPGILGDTIRPVSEWLIYWQSGGKTKPLIIVNPLTGLPAMKKDGSGETYRGDGNVKEYRYCLVEFDNLPREEQIRFWTTIKLPVVALIDSGNKSIHGWLDVQKLATVTTSEQWENNIKNRLYDRLLAPLGVDGACSNPARLSRLPGHFREDKGKYQRLLWLSPGGRPIWK